jgi:four helix bundle protein
VIGKDGQEVQVATESFRQLAVWRQAHQLVLDVYRKTSTFPAEERYGLVSQMRRAAISVPANIAEGYKRRGSRDKVRFYNLAEASLEELRYYLILCHELGLMGNEVELESNAGEVSRMLGGLIRRIETR